MRRCQAGERDAFQLVVERYGDVVLGTALLMTGDRPLAEDLAQEAFVQAWRGMRGFRLGSPLKPWLLRILVNRVASHRRRRLLDLVPLPWAERTAAGDPDPASVIEVDQERTEVRSAVTSLPEDQRRLIVLRFYAELSVRDISRATGLPEGTVKSRLHRAIGRLRELLEGNESQTERGVAP